MYNNYSTKKSPAESKAYNVKHMDLSIFTSFINAGNDLPISSQRYQ
jgi:hypothetical protein